ncbi:cellulose biosynthesis protein BcsQ [Candidatus Nitrotoga sp. AM1P]|uniref:cellulose biosynthesis protein BcsQ n=1 Tax=Candidatus Nitrotoga sp. AM1P TaxID=2559597 RepID=UPI0010B1951F|nr:cellulose biosynthesis protein BcsQ [Candidatus Nitrotoga sp. AM1P]BBJ22959.1 cellulose synthase operon protein YhjQ [Candidatus Nitrotoga sp. AM1P]
MFKIAIVSAAGGVGRSTLTASLATLLAQREIAALALDFDPQNLLSTLLGSDEASLSGLLPDFLTRKEFGKSALVNANEVACLPFGRANEASLVTFEQHLRAEPEWLKKCIAQVDYPSGAFLLMDTPRLPSLYARQAVVAADLVLAVLAPDVRSLALLPVVENTLSRCAPGSQLIYVVNSLDSTRALQSDLLARFRSTLQMRLSPYPVHRDEAIPRAVANRTNLQSLSPDSLVAHDLNGLLNWLLAGPASSLDGRAQV